MVDVCTPGDSHAEIAIAALAAGKHVLCEKPLANTVDEARAMVAAAAKAQAAGVRSMCGFNYRRVPAVTLMRQLVASGRLGVIRHVRAVYLQDWIVDPQFPLVWRLQRDRAGSGALGDIGAHIIDLTQYVTGQRITGVSAITETFVKERPLPAESSGLAASAGNGSVEARATGEVTVDDAARLRGAARRRGARHVRGEPLRDRAQERAAGRDQRIARLGRRSTSNGSTSWSSTTPPARPPSRASTGSW